MEPQKAAEAAAAAAAEGSGADQKSKKKSKDGNKDGVTAADQVRISAKSKVESLLRKREEKMQRKE